jgi:hypothetical protein
VDSGRLNLVKPPHEKLIHAPQVGQIIKKFDQFVNAGGRILAFRKSFVHFIPVPFQSPRVFERGWLTIYYLRENGLVRLVEFETALFQFGFVIIPADAGVVVVEMEQISHGPRRVSNAFRRSATR